MGIFDKKPKKDDQPKKPKLHSDSELSKIGKSFIYSDLDDVKDHVYKKIIKPYLHRLFLDSFHASIDMIFGGDGKGGVSGLPSSSSSANKTSYSAYYGKNNNANKQPSFERPVAKDSLNNYREVEVESEQLGWECIRKAENLLIRKHYITIADWYNICECGTPPYTLDEYGWKSLVGSDVQFSRGVWIIKLPRPRSIKLTD